MLPIQIFGLSTARRLEDVQQLAGRLKGYPLSFIGTSNGAELYLNRDNLPADEWLLSLTPQDRDAAWDQEVQQRLPGWDPATAVPDVLSCFGFVEIPGDRPGRGRHFRREEAKVSIFPGNSAFSLKGGRAGLGREIAGRLQAAYEDLGITSADEVNHTRSGYETHQVVPVEVNKLTLLEHLLTQYPSVTTVFTAGDGPADKQLYPNQVAGRENYRIVAGESAELAKRMAGQEHVVRVASGDLGPGIQQHLDSL